MILLKILNEKMKKVLFFMFLLFLCLGTASVKAQVRIGGNTAPNASAVLDLNANDTNNGTKGLALPRVGLTSNTMLLPGVTSNLTGMMVYNTTITGGAGVNTIGIYFWNGATWIKASFPSTSAADSGKLLMSNGTTWVAAPRSVQASGLIDTLNLRTRRDTVTLSLVLDTVVTLSRDIPDNQWVRFIVPGLISRDNCVSVSNFDGNTTNCATMVNVNGLYAWKATGGIMTAGSNIRLRCFRASL